MQLSKLFSFKSNQSWKSNLAKETENYALWSRVRDSLKLACHAIFSRLQIDKCYQRVIVCSSEKGNPIGVDKET